MRIIPLNRIEDGKEVHPAGETWDCPDNKEARRLIKIGAARKDDTDEKARKAEEDEAARKAAESDQQ